MIKKAEHVALIVTDMERSIQYYSSMFGYKLRTRGQSATRDMAFLYHDDQPGFEIELIRDLKPLGEYSDSGIVNHLAFTVENIEEAMEYYRQKGVQFNSEKPNTAIDGAKTIFFHGPDRELLQFVQPNRERV
ncbi:VOC family protein [Brevibacillus massiliensis]|uniref:VOC family protein n=1 Tax=Brevibacillus massiliensis TaxID=1118054 RepID=UPI0002E7BA27|nr:VOC family protein [Brevibacillus massiliensis]